MNDSGPSNAKPPAKIGPLFAAATSAGAIEVVEQLLECYRPYLLAIANEQLESDLRPKLGPSDLVQDTLFEANRDFRRATFRSETELRGWLGKLLLNNLLDARKRYHVAQIRSTRSEQPLSSPDSRLLMETLIDPKQSPRPMQGVTPEEVEAFDIAIERLRPEYRQLLVWHYCEHRTYAEIGELVGRSADAIRMVCNRVVLRLRRELETMT